MIKAWRELVPHVMAPCLGGSIGTDSSSCTYLTSFVSSAEDAECLFTARRDNYVARTFSHMARARLDHAVSRSADLGQLGSEKWEMRYFHSFKLWAQSVPSSRMSEGKKYIEQH